MHIMRTLLFPRLVLTLLFSLSAVFASAAALPGKGAAPQVAKPKFAPAAADPGATISLPQPMREWTVMVFANGRNDLAPNLLRDANEMEASGSGPNVNVVLELGMMNHEYLKETGVKAWRGNRRFYITRDGNMEQLSSIPLPGEFQADMASYRHLIHFGKWVKQNFPAKKYMLIVSNHGDGLDGISYDDISMRNMSMEGLGKAVSGIGGVDVYASDACLMQMAEVAYALKGSAKAVVGSEEIVPLDGYDYTALVDELKAKPGMGAEEASQMLVRTFDKSYEGSGEYTTLSALKMTELGKLSPLIKAWTEAAMLAPDAALLKAVREARAFDTPSYRDLHHFVTIAARQSKDAALLAATDALTGFIDNTLLLGNEQRHLKQANGLAVYIPTSARIMASYKKTAFAEDSGWYSFLNWMRKQGLLYKDLR